jgi:hypothetical protein
MVKIVGNGHEVEIQYDFTDNIDDDLREYFIYRGNRYDLADFAAVHNKMWNPNPPQWMLPFDGYLNDTFFSGILIKYCEDGDHVKVYTFY